MKIKWWQILAMVLMVYVIVAGTLIPLKPGIKHVSPIRIQEFQNQTFDIEGYNTSFKQEDTRAWIVARTGEDKEDLIVSAKTVLVESAVHLKATFFVTDELLNLDSRNRDLVIFIDNPRDGCAIMPTGIRLVKGEGGPSSAMSMQPLSTLHVVDSFRFPFRNVLHETIRNTFFHVAIWMSMFILLMVSCYHSIRYLRSSDLYHDKKSSSLTSVSLYFGIAGLLTGSLWAKYTWGSFWTNDIKLNMTAIALLIYFAYWVLRASITDLDSRARLSSVYNLASFVVLMILVMVIPRMTDSLHPGNGGNPALGGEDLDHTLRAVFYPAIIAYTLFGFWMANLYYRYLNLEYRLSS